MRKWLAAAAALALLAIPAAFHLRGDRTAEDVVVGLGPSVRPRLQRLFDEAGCGYPPREVSLVALKEERRLEVWACDDDPRWRRIAEYRILAASGTAGPKRAEGDGQVPEGLYRIVALNPNSRFHLSMKIDYPNEADRKRGATGSDIFIHGGSASIGCIAVGDPAIEELFLLVHDAGPSRTAVTIAPRDFRTAPPTIVAGPSWVAALYDRIEEDLRRKSVPAPPAAPPEPR